jgi:flagellar motor switch protein FliN
MAKKEEKLEEKDTDVVEAEVLETTKEITEELTEEVNENAAEAADENADAEKDVQVESSDETTSDEIDIDRTVTVQPVKFASFEDLSHTQGEINKNLEILMDIKLQLTVELGRTELPIKKVLELTRGSIIELEKVAGEPVELYANGKLVAHGEVVVIEDNFGLRITSITEPEDRLKGIS